MDRSDSPVLHWWTNSNGYIEPMSKFPVNRDLSVDRSRMFDALKKVQAWVPVDGYHDLGPGEKILPAHQKVAYELSKCMTCGCCVEACPQYSKDNNFLGAAALSQARLFNMHPTGKNLKKERLDTLMQEGGISSCEMHKIVLKRVRSIPLTESIAHLGKMSQNNYGVTFSVETNKLWYKGRNAKRCKYSL